MQLYGGLWKLNGNHRLFVPRYPRVPLGFLSRTWVHVGLIDCERFGKPGRPGDIVVSVLDPKHWGEAFSLRAHCKDEAGMVPKLLRETSDFNVALAETASVMGTSIQDSTVERTHEVSLIIEPLDQVRWISEKQVDSGGNAIAPRPVSAVKESLEREGWHVDSLEKFSPLGQLMWTGYFQIDKGHIDLERWDIKRVIRETFPHWDDQNYDLTVACVTADIPGRFLRYVIPRLGACELSIEHRDTPGALLKLTDAIANAGGSILSSLLRRGGSKPNHATLLAVIEPKEGGPGTQLALKLRGELAKLSGPEHKLGLGPPEITLGHRPPDCHEIPRTKVSALLAHDRGTQVAAEANSGASTRSPFSPDIRSKSAALSANLDSRRPNVFVTTDAEGDYRRGRFVESVEKFCLDSGFSVLPSRTVDWNSAQAGAHIRASLLACHALVVCALRTEGEQKESRQRALAAVAGMAEALDRPLLIVLEEGRALFFPDEFSTGTQNEYVRLSESTVCRVEEFAIAGSQIQRWLDSTLR